MSNLIETQELGKPMISTRKSVRRTPKEQLEQIKKDRELKEEIKRETKVPINQLNILGMLGLK